MDRGLASLCTAVVQAMHVTSALRSSREALRAQRQVIVLANRAPVTHVWNADGRLRIHKSASGLVTALEPLVAACSGTWVAHGVARPGYPSSGVRDDLEVPPANTPYHVRGAELTPDEYRGYYYGFSNEGLWPLCHAAGVEPTFRAHDFRMYRIANERFARAAAQEAVNPTPIVLVQDYHLAMAPRMLRRHLPLSVISSFWHIPWPHPRVFKTCPWGPELLRGLLASDVAGFQTADDCAHFIEAVRSSIDCEIDRDRGVIRCGGHMTLVRAYPVGVEWHNDVVRAAPEAATCRARVFRNLGLDSGTLLGVGIDRLDYTKGINEKFLAIERLLDRHADLRERFVFVQVAEPSRDCLPAYRAARTQLVATCERVNQRFGSGPYRPIVLLEHHHDPAQVYELYRAANVCYVGSLHDGMNLVAKEFICARDDERGVLLLSRFAGASQQLASALIVNPHDVDDGANALARALIMAPFEQTSRMRRLRRIVASTDAHWWAGRVLGDAMSISRQERDFRARGALRTTSYSSETMPDFS
jgi:trehalose 6-phosphate synthase